MGYDVQSLKDRFSSPYVTDERITGDELDPTADFPVTMNRPGNLHQIIVAMRNAMWEQVETDLADLETQLVPKTKTSGFLDNWAAQLLEVHRRTDESDASYRIRVQGELLARFGATHPDDVLRVVETLLDASEGDVSITENQDDNDNFEQAHFEVTFSQTLLEDLGFESPFTDIINDIEAILARVSAAGVSSEVVFETDAEYDSATYDSDVYG